MERTCTRDEAEELSAYELQRKDNIARNEAALKALGLLDGERLKEGWLSQRKRKRAAAPVIGTQSVVLRKSPRLSVQAAATSVASISAGEECEAQKAHELALLLKTRRCKEVVMKAATVEGEAVETAARGVSGGTLATAEVLVRAQMTASGFKGVYRYKDAWQVTWPCYLGKRFPTAEAAAAAIAQFLGPQCAHSEAAAAEAAAQHAEKINGAMSGEEALRGASAEACVLEYSPTLPSGFVGVYGTGRRRRPWCAVFARP